jgi:hypothetical protein
MGICPVSKISKIDNWLAKADVILITADFKVAGSADAAWLGDLLSL